MIERIKNPENMIQKVDTMKSTCTNKRIYSGNDLRAAASELLDKELKGGAKNDKGQLLDLIMKTYIKTSKET